eukprot:857-Heterococcus_DN1.PRE.2
MANAHTNMTRRRTQKLYLDTVLAAAVAKEAQERTDIHKLQQPARWGARLYLGEYKLVAVIKHKSAVYNTATSARYSYNSDIAFFTLAYPQASQGLNLQRSLLSPRALQQGWREELDNNITHYRKEITKVGIITQLLHAIHSSTSYLLENVTYADSRAQTCYNTCTYPNKLELLFGTCVEVRSIEADISKRYEQEHELRQSAERISRWRQEGKNEMTIWDNKQRAIHKAAAAKRRIADERRRWTVSHNTATGKPDITKKIARARPLDYAYAITDPIIAAQHATFTGGDVDLFAFERDDNENDSNASGTGVPLRRQQQQQQQQHRHTANRSSLNRVVEQIAQFERVLAPISDIMKKHGIGVITTATASDNQDSSNEHRGTATGQSEKRRDGATGEIMSHLGNAQESDTPANDATDTAADQTDGNNAATLGTQTLARTQLVVKADDATHSDSDSTSSSSSDALDNRSRQPSYKRNTRNRNVTPTTPPSTSKAAFSGFADIHGYGSSPVTRGRPDVPSNISNDKVPLTFNESQRVKNRQRQRLLHSVEDLDIVQTHESMSRVPWAELDTLIALKEELRAAKAVKSMLHK